MSVSLYIEGISEADEEYKAYLNVYESCRRLGVRVPDEVDRYFGGNLPDQNGQTVDIDSTLTDFRDRDYSGYYIDLAKLPKSVKKIKVYLG